MGTVIGPWRVVDWGGRGVYGAVYRAVRGADEQADSVALKVALLPRDPRFAREVELLSRIRHPSVPRLLGHGEWQHPSGTLYPYLAMEWVDGAPLYDWARQHNPTSQQVLRLLAQLARALQAVHIQGGVHRDVKGDNVLVRRSDSRAVLMDFGAGNYPGAATLTPQSMFPGTPAYRAPEAWLSPLRLGRNPVARYGAGPADDVYALGVTAYQLLTGQYPKLGEPRQDEAGIWQLEDVAPPAPHVLNPRVELRLSALILRMLSVRPEVRGTAAELAEALEQAAENPVPESTQPLFHREALPPMEGPGEEAVAASALGHSPRPSGRAEARASEPRERAVEAAAEGRVLEESAGTRGSAEFKRSRAHARPWRSSLAMAAASLTLAAWAWWAALGQAVENPSALRQAAGSTDQENGRTAGLGEAASTASMEDSPDASVREVLAEDTLPEPVPGQARPDAKGRCPHKRQVALSGGCWGRLNLDREKCEEVSGHMSKDTCYVPILPPGRPPTSSPTRKP
jgi:hypothetical protein